VSEPDTSPAPPPPAAKPRFDWWAELKAILLLALGVLALHSFVAKPFYIASESMMPGLIKGDRLIVTKYAYGWSWVSPTFHVLPESRGRLFGRMPERGDIVVFLPRGAKEDWIKRVIGISGDSVAMRSGEIFLNGRPVKRERRPDAMLPVDANLPCGADQFGEHRSAGPDGRMVCRLPVYRETLPGGRNYDTIDEGRTPADDFGPVTVPQGSVFLMGDNRDNSADSRVPGFEGGLGGPVPWENIGGRAEFILYSYDGSFRWYNPLSWFAALRGGRAGTSLRAGPAS
jgi:signal peptidase I